MNAKHLKDQHCHGTNVLNCNFEVINNDTIKLNNQFKQYCHCLLYITASLHGYKQLNVSGETDAVSQCVQRSRHSPVADIAAQLLQSPLMKLRDTSQTLGRCLAACVLYYYRFAIEVNHKHGSV